MAYRTRNIIFEARLLWLKAYRTRNVTFEGRLFWFMAYRTRNVTLVARLLWFRLIERGMLHWERACCGLGL